MNASLYSSSCQRPATSAGFTLIELMVTIAVLAIIVSIAAPNISNQLANQRVKSTASTIENALKEAKAESIIRRQNITVLYNANANPKTVTVLDGSNPLSTYNVHSQSIVNQIIVPASVTAVTFQPNKVMFGGANVTYTICDSASTNETPRQVSLSSIANINTTNTGSC
ncbi:GspH/FimT family pseudopilin [Psychrobacter sp. P11G5]|uniref:pilus assembly FimT family protein n=1 Tax=Psychrobacter sp. P11G5 TaxID=1699624 RepID=UPI000A5BC696|nr:GspH/FimT family pseudopilin [Psychrobacter sp. P11G5]